MTNSRQQAAKASISANLMVAKEIFESPRPVISFVNRRLLTKNEFARVKAGGRVFFKDVDGCWNVAVYVPERKVVNSFQADSELVAMIDAELRSQAMSAVIGKHLGTDTAPVTARRRMTV